MYAVILNKQLFKLFVGAAVAASVAAAICSSGPVRALSAAENYLKDVSVRGASVGDNDLQQYSALLLGTVGGGPNCLGSDTSSKNKTFITKFATDLQQGSSNEINGFASKAVATINSVADTYQSGRYTMQQVCDITADAGAAAGIRYAGQPTGTQAIRADITDKVVDLCTGRWNQDLGITGSKTTYTNVLDTLSNADFSNKVQKNYANGDASRCPDIAAAIGLKARLLSQAKTDLNNACKGNTAALADITKFKEQQLLDGAAVVDQGCDAAIAAAKGDTGTTTEQSSCKIDGIGWIVCPVMAFMAKMNDAAYTFLQSFLTIRPALVTDPATLKAWSTFRDIANIAFVISFMVIVYSQITNAGISNYGIKKMLPRIVLAAILVNISYYICELLIDASNIVGSSIYTLFNSIDVGGADVAMTGWEDLISKILAAAAIGIGTVLLVLAVLMAPTALLAFAVILLVLVARQAFVILLVVVAPLAFVAYLLPNTESFFKRWWKMLTTVLMVYPIVGAVFGASTLASKILMNVAQSGKEDETLLQLIALGVLAIPLFAVPLLLKGSLSAAGNIGARIAGLGDKANRMASGQLGDRVKQMGGGVRDLATERAMNGGQMFGAGALIRGRARRNQRYDALSRRAKAASTGFTATDERASAFERAALNSEQTAKLEKGINEAAAEVEHLEANVDLNVRGKVADMQVEGAKAAESALVKEISSGSSEGFAAGTAAGLSADTITLAHNAHEQIEIEGKRANSAARIGQEELATRIRNPATGYATQAAGIGGTAAMSRVIGEATQIEFKAFDDAVSAEQTTMTDLKGIGQPGEEDLMGIVMNDTLSTERRAAAAGMIMKNGGMNEIQKLVDNAQSLGNSNGASAIRKQMMGDMNRTPFGMGAGDIAAYKRGEVTVDPANGAPKTYATMMELRAQKKLSDAKWSSLDPDDQSAYATLATSGSLSNQSLQNLVNATYAAENNENISVTDEAKAHGAAIRAHAATLGIVPN